MSLLSLAPATLEHYQTKIKNYIFHATSIGSPDAKHTVLFFHGWQESGAAPFFPFLHQFRYDNSIRVIAVDLPGFGTHDTSKTITPHFEEYIDLVQAWAEQYTTERQVDLVGYSFGGVVAAELVARRPEHYRRLTLLAAPLSEVASPAVPHVFASVDWENLYRSYQEHIQSTTLIKHLTLPVLLIWGTRDMVVPLHQGRTLNTQLANSRMIVLDEQDHKLYHTPEQLYLPIKQYILA